MASKVGTLIKEARKLAGLTQEKLAMKLGGGLTAADIGKAERGELTLPVATLRKIAKLTGVTQASLVNAAKGTGSTAAGTAAAKPPANASMSMRVTSTEKKLIESYRKADTATKKAALDLLKGKSTSLLSTLVGGSTGTSATGQDQGSVAEMITDAIGSLLGKS